MADYHTKDVADVYAFSVYHEIWRCNVWFVWGPSSSRIYDFLITQHDGDKNDIWRAPKHVYAHVQRLDIEGQCVPAVVLPWEWESTPQKIATLAHECLHAAIILHRIRHIPLPKDIHHENNDEEGLCYLTDWLIQKFLEAQQNEKDHLWKFSNEIKLDRFEY